MSTVAPRFVHVDGEVLPADEAKVSALDAGFLYGDGIYETMRSYGGRVFALSRHFARLHRSADSVGIRLPPEAVLRAALEEIVEANGTPEATVRLTITRGPLGRRLDLSTSGDPTVVITTDPVDPASDAERRRGIRVVYSGFLRLSEYPLAGVKSTNYQISLFARNEARERGALEVLVPNESGEIVEGAAANVFLVEGERLTTPPLRSGILGGITREVVMELGAKRGLKIQEATLPRERIESGDELFLSGTTIQVAPVVEIEDRPMGSGRPGPTTLALLDDYLAAVRADTGAAPPEPSERMR